MTTPGPVADGHEAGRGGAPSIDVAIVGGGIGGLAAAVALRRVGFDAHVYERTPVLREVGGVIVIREPSLRLLEEWELGAFYDGAVLLEIVELRDGGSGELIRTSSTDFVGDGVCYASHRADVHDLLRDALPPEVIHLGLGAERVTNDDARGAATIHFSDGSNITARVVVGADGIRSAVRAAVCEDELIFQGAVTIRTASPAGALSPSLSNDRARMWVRDSRMLLTLPMRAGRTVAIDAIVDSIAGDLTAEDPWEIEIPKDRLLERYADFHPDLVSLIRSGTAPVRAHPIYDRDPIETWVQGRIVLLGDAAHPMTPRHGQGANQALQDAGVLAQELARSGLEDPTDGLTRYQQRRVGPATDLQTASRGAPEQLYRSAAD